MGRGSKAPDVWLNTWGLKQSLSINVHQSLVVCCAAIGAYIGGQVLGAVWVMS